METIIYRNIRKIRIEKNFTQEYMAEEMSISQTYYSKIERGEKDITLSQIVKITKIFNIDTETLFEQK